MGLPEPARSDLLGDGLGLLLLSDGAGLLHHQLRRGVGCPLGSLLGGEVLDEGVGRTVDEVRGRRRDEVEGRVLEGHRLRVAVESDDDQEGSQHPLRGALLGARVDRVTMLCCEALDGLLLLCGEGREVY
jgi:hypothetical protein